MAVVRLLCGSRLWNHPDLLEHPQLVEDLPLLGDLRALEARDDLAGDVDPLAGRLDVLERTVVCSGRPPSGADQIPLRYLLLDSEVQVGERREVGVPPTWWTPSRLR